MWFKNLYFFAFTRPFEWSAQDLEKHLAEHLFTPCGSTEMSHFGWVNALGKHGNASVHTANGTHLICARKEEKIIPAPVVKDMLEEKVNLLEQEQGRGASKKEKEQFKEDIIFELMPRAFSRITDTHAYISPAKNIIVINSSSRGKAEDLLALLRKVLGTLPVTSVSSDRAPDEVMTEWLSDGTLPSNFSLGMECELKALGDDAAVVRVKNQDLTGDEIKIHLDSDKFVQKVKIEFDETMSFTLTDDLAVKGVKFFDVIHEQNDDIDSDDVVAKLDADFALMSGEIDRMILSLCELFSVTPMDFLEEK